jgi:hypothetical protein
MADRQDEVVQVIIIFSELIVGEHVLAEVVVSGMASICPRGVSNDSNFRLKGDLFDVQLLLIRLRDVSRRDDDGGGDVGFRSGCWDLRADFMILSKWKLFVLIVGHDHEHSRGTKGLELADGESLTAVEIVDDLVGVVVDVAILVLSMTA